MTGNALSRRTIFYHLHAAEYATTWEQRLEHERAALYYARKYNLRDLLPFPDASAPPDVLRTEHERIRKHMMEQMRL